LTVTNQTASKPQRPLTRRQRAFVAILPTVNNGAEAARQAGYSDAGGAAKVRAAELVTNSNVATAIQERETQIAQRREWTLERYLDEIESCLRGCERQADTIAALTLLGKATALLRERSEISIVQLDAYGRRVVEAVTQTLDALVAGNVLSVEVADGIRAGIAERLES
jgi:predicted ATP-dependent protease